MQPLTVLAQLDIRVGTITAVVDVPDSAKLVELTVEFGHHHRATLAGLKRKRADPHEIEERQTLFVRGSQ
jgi:tRNA-binding protein